MYEPVIISRPNICPKCGNIGMNLAMLEINVMTLRSDGSMVHHHTSGPEYRLACDRCGYQTSLVELPKYGPIRLRSAEDGYVYPCAENVDPYESVEEKTFEGNPFADVAHTELFTPDGKRIHIYGDPSKSHEFENILAAIRRLQS